MHALVTVLGVIDILLCIVLVGLVMMQEGSSQGLGTISGGADTFFGQHKGRSIDALLKKITSVLVIVFVIITVLLNVLIDRV